MQYIVINVNNKKLMVDVDNNNFFNKAIYCAVFNFNEKTTNKLYFQ